MLTYQLNHDGESSLYFQLYQAIRADIESGTLASGERLPSKRLLAQHLGTSVITVEGAYRQLQAEGYLRSELRRGYFVCDIAAGLRERARGDETPASLASFEGPRVPAPSTQAQATSPLLADLTGARPAKGLFPYKAWARTMRAVLSAEDEDALLSASDAQGSLQLRREIARYVQGFRGMQVSPEQILIGSGAQSLYGLVVQLLGRERVYAVEDPGYPRLVQIYRSNKVSLAPIGLSEEGPVLEELQASQAGVLHCMPSHQFPTGITTGIGRRLQLLEWAAEGGCGQERRYIIEDDYDCEFRMSGRPVPPLQAFDERECVIYANTFTKTLGAAFRIGYMILPPHLAQRFREELGFYACTVGALEQLTLAAFMRSGDYERHVNRQRVHFKRVQEQFIQAMRASGAARWVRFANQDSGLHFLMLVDAALPPAETEEAIRQRACAKGVALSPLGAYFMRPSHERPACFVMNLASVEGAQLPSIVQALSEAIEEVCAAAGSQ